MAAMRVRPGRVSGHIVRDNVCHCYTYRKGSHVTIMAWSKNHHKMSLNLREREAAFAEKFRYRWLLSAKHGHNLEHIYIISRN